MHFPREKSSNEEKRKKNLFCKVDGSEGNGDHKCYLSLQND